MKLVVDKDIVTLTHKGRLDPRMQSGTGGVSLNNRLITPKSLTENSTNSGRGTKSLGLGHVHTTMFQKKFL